MVNNHVYALRLRPNQDLKQEIVAFAKSNNIQAGYIHYLRGKSKKSQSTTRQSARSNYLGRKI